MNERIKQFAVKAGAGHRAGVSGLVFRDNELEKFAELIIRECMTICGAIQGAGESSNMSDFASGAARCKAIIKRDFGVK